MRPHHVRLLLTADLVLTRLTRQGTPNCTCGLAWEPGAMATFASAFHLIWGGLLATDDNMYLRCLLGEEAFLTPLGGLNRSYHLDRGRTYIGQYSVVLILEQFEEQLLQLQEVFQWRIPSQWRDKMRMTKRPKRRTSQGTCWLAGGLIDWVQCALLHCSLP